MKQLGLSFSDLSCRHSPNNMMSFHSSSEEGHLQRSRLAQHAFDDDHRVLCE